MKFQSTKILELGSCAFRQWKADSHCRFVHGYRLVAKFWFGASDLDHRNWVVDFGGLKGLKQILEKQFDHTLCVSADDPHLELFKHLHDHCACDLRIMDKGVGIERTAEWCFEKADAYIRSETNNRCWVEKVEVWEHEKNSAIASAGYYNAPDHTPYVAAQEITPTTAPSPAVLEKDNATRVAPNVTTGWGNPFGGTSWGM